MVVLSVTIKDAFAGTEILYAMYPKTVALANVGLFPIATVADTADADVFVTTIESILFTEATAGVNPVSAVVPLYVQETTPFAAAGVATVVAGTMYAVLP